MKTRVLSICLIFSLAQSMMAQLTPLGLIEESNIATVDKNGYLRFIPELSFEDDYLYVATPKGLYRSLYKSQSEWEKLPLTDELVLDFEVRGDTLVILTRSQLLYSLDGGETAESESIADIIGEDSDWNLEGMAVHPHDANHIFVATNGAGLWQTNDGGTEWVQVTKDDGKKVSLTRLLYNPHDANQLIGIYNNSIMDYGSLIFSHNGGSQWKPGRGEYTDSNISQVCNVAFHPTIRSKAAACGVSVYALTDDGGASWTGVFNPKWWQTIVHITDVIYDPRNPEILYGADFSVAKEGITSVLRSTDGGYTWEEFYYENIASDGYVLSMDMRDNILALYTYGNGIQLLDVDAIDASVSPIVNDEDESAYYDIQGRKVTHPTHGIYIKDGRKVVVE